MDKESTRKEKEPATTTTIIIIIINLLWRRSTAHQQRLTYIETYGKNKSIKKENR